MKKNIIIVMALCVLFITGCGCDKKTKEETLKCVSEMNEYGEKNIVTAKFADDYLVSEEVETIIEFENEILAQRYYDMYKDNERYNVTLDGNTVTNILQVKNDSKDDIYKIEQFKDDLVKNGYVCDNNKK